MLEIEYPQYRYGRDLIIIGDGNNAEIMAYLFENDTTYNLAGFAVHRKYYTDEYIFGYPVYILEDLEQDYPPAEADVFVAIGYSRMNHTRADIFNNMKNRGYTCASYISRNGSTIYPNITFGENVFIFENNVIQYDVKIGNNVIMWSGNHVGHKTIIENHVYLSSHCVISGYCTIGEYSFLGVNSTVIDNVEVGPNSLIAANTLIRKNVVGDKVYTGKYEINFNQLSNKSKKMFSYI